MLFAASPDMDAIKPQLIEANQESALISFQQLSLNSMQSAYCYYVIQLKNNTDYTFYDVKILAHRYAKSEMRVTIEDLDIEHKYTVRVVAHRIIADLQSIGQPSQEMEFKTGLLSYTPSLSLKQAEFEIFCFFWSFA